MSALLLAGKLLSVDPLAGNLLELDAIAAVVIGGASRFGGRGSIVGTLIGVFIMVMIRNGLNLLGYLHSGRVQQSGLSSSPSSSSNGLSADGANDDRR